MLFFKKLNAQKERHYYLMKIINNVFIKKDINIIDIGCGHAYLAKLLKNKKYENILGVDKVKRSFIKNKEYLNDYRKLNLNNRNINIKKKFDLIVCSEVIEHLDDTCFILTKMKSLLKKNGYIILTVPNIENIFSRITFFLTGAFKRYPVEQKNTFSHVSIINKEILTSYLNRLNLKIIQILGGKIFIKNICIFPQKYFSVLWSWDSIYIIKKNF